MEDELETDLGRDMARIPSAVIPILDAPMMMMRGPGPSMPGPPFQQVRLVLHQIHILIFLVIHKKIKC